MRAVVLDLFVLFHYRFFCRCLYDRRYSKLPELKDLEESNKLDEVSILCGIFNFYIVCELFLTQWAKSPKKQSEGVRFLLIRHSNYNAVLSKILLLQTVFW